MARFRAESFKNEWPFDIDSANHRLKSVSWAQSPNPHAPPYPGARLIERIGTAWSSHYTELNNRDLQGDPRSFMMTLGHPILWEFWGFKELNDSLLWVPSPEFLNSKIELINGVLGRRKISWSYKSVEGVDSETPEGFLKSFSGEKMQLIMAKSGHLGIHDISYHTPFFLPNYVWEIQQARIKTILRYLEFLRTEVKKETRNSILKKELAVFRTDLTRSEAIALDGANGNFCYWMKNLSQFRNPKYSKKNEAFESLYRQSYEAATFNGKGGRGLLEAILEMLQKPTNGQFLVYRGDVDQYHFWTGPLSERALKFLKEKTLTFLKNDFGEDPQTPILKKSPKEFFSDVFKRRDEIIRAILWLQTREV